MRATGTTARQSRGSQLIADGDGRCIGFRPLARCGHLSDDTPLGELEGRRLRADLAVVLRHGVPAGASPGAVVLAAAGVCVVLAVVDDRDGVVALWVGEHLLPLSADGQVRLDGGGAVSTTVPADPGDRVPQLQWLAATAGGLDAGELVLTVPRRSGAALPAAAGPWEACFPDAATLSVRVTA